MQIGASILRQMADMYRKVRGTLRFLLGNLADYDPAVHAVPYEQLPSLDRYILFRLSGLMNEISAAYDSYQVRQLQAEGSVGGRVLAVRRCSDGGREGAGAPGADWAPS